MTDQPKKKTLLDLNKEDQAEIKTGKAMEELQTFEGWKFYHKVVENHLETQRKNVEVSAPVAGEDGLAYALRMERAKGTIIGIRLALDLPSSMISAAKDLRNRLLGSESED